MYEAKTAQSLSEFKCNHFPCLLLGHADALLGNILLILYLLCLVTCCNLFKVVLYSVWP